MKIAIVTNFLYPDGLGGTELYCYQLANALVERGNEVYWFVPNFSSAITAVEERGKGIRIVKFSNGLFQSSAISLKTNMSASI